MATEIRGLHQAAVVFVTLDGARELAGEWKLQRLSEGPRSMVTTLRTGGMPAALIKTTRVDPAAEEGQRHVATVGRPLQLGLPDAVRRAPGETILGLEAAVSADLKMGQAPG